MPNWTPRATPVRVSKVKAVSGGRFLQLDDGSVLDSKLNPVAQVMPGDMTGWCVVLMAGAVRLAMPEPVFLELFELVEDDFDVEELREMVEGVEYVHSGLMTVCILAVGESRFAGHFHSTPGLSLTQDELQELAYAAAFHELVTFHTVQRANLLTKKDF